ncbi:MAG TPA: hypothetical protein VGL53_22730 [Bryobacteraceae bacterium]
MAQAIEQPLNYALLAVAFAVTVFTATCCVLAYSPTPVLDSWEVLVGYNAYNFHTSIDSLVYFHNEHRPLFARVVMLTDMLHLGGKSYLTYGCIFLTQACHAFLLWTIARKQTWIERRDWAITGALAIYCCFSPAQIENLGWPFQIAFVLPFFLGTAAICAVATQKERPAWQWGLAVIVLASSAPLGLASGTLVWWIVVAMAVAVRLSWKWISIYCAAALATSYAYFHNFPKLPYHTDPLEAIRRPLEIAYYVVMYLGNSWKLWAYGASWEHWSHGVGEWLAAAALALLAFHLIRFIRARIAPADSPAARGANPWEAAVLAVMLLSTGTASVTALGRMNFGVDQAAASRYQTPALLFWFMAGVLVLGMLPKNVAWAKPVFAVLLLAGMLASFQGTHLALDSSRARKAELNIAGSAWASGVEDMDAMKSVTVFNYLSLRQPYLERHLSLFSISPFSNIGQRLDPSRIEFGNACLGRFERDKYFSSAEFPGIRLKGWAKRSSDGEVVDQFLSTTPDGRVVGVGAAGVVYAGVKNASDPVIVYGLLGHNKVCAISTQ